MSVFIYGDWENDGGIFVWSDGRVWAVRRFHGGKATDLAWCTSFDAGMAAYRLLLGQKKWKASRQRATVATDFFIRKC